MNIFFFYKAVGGGEGGEKMCVPHTFSGSDNGTQEPRMMSQFITDASYPQLSFPQNRA